VFALNVIEFQLQMSGNYFLMLSNPHNMHALLLLSNCYHLNAVFD